MSAGGGARRYALTVDVEDWYHDGGLAAPPSQRRVEANTESLLELFAAGGARATFFFLAEVAEEYPQLVRRAADGGHEIASHGYRHKPLSDLLRHEFRHDVQRSVAILEDVAGCRVRGYRAPYFSIKAGVRWPLDVLAEAGLAYDSSILAVDRPPGLELVCPRAPFQLHNGLWEVPVSILRVFHFWHLPLASGAGLRMLPPALLARFLRAFEREVGAAVFYLHPWEIDPQSPTGPGRGRWLLRIGRQRLGARLRALLAAGCFGTIAETFADRLGCSLPVAERFGAARVSLPCAEIGF
jgi:polysaccharide deacetylase family protein (PEP-CTERM system associated)